MKSNENSFEIYDILLKATKLGFIILDMTTPSFRQYVMKKDVDFVHSFHESCHGMKLIFTSSKIGNLKLDMPKHNSLMATHYVYSLDNVQSRIGNPIRTTSPHFFLL